LLPLNRLAPTDRSGRLAASHENVSAGSSSALWKALHKADYAKYPIMESGWSELVPSADWQ